MMKCIACDSLMYTALEETRYMCDNCWNKLYPIYAPEGIIKEHRIRYLEKKIKEITGCGEYLTCPTCGVLVNPHFLVDAPGKKGIKWCKHCANEKANIYEGRKESSLCVVCGRPLDIYAGDREACLSCADRMRNTPYKNGKGTT